MEKENGYVMKLPESEKPKEEVREPNKAPFWSMRIAGGLIDICLMFLAIFGLRYLFNYTPVTAGLTENYNEMLRIADSYRLEPLISDSEETIGYKMYSDDPSFNDDKYKNYPIYTYGESTYKVVSYDNPSKELVTKFNEVVANDQYYKGYKFNYQLYDFGIMCLAAAISEGVFLLVVPLTNKRRATLGMLAAGTQMINSKYETQAKWYQVVGRFFWIYLVECALPYFFLTNFLLVTLIIQPVMYIISLFNEKHRFIHDYVTRTLIIDKSTFVPLDEQ